MNKKIYKEANQFETGSVWEIPFTDKTKIRNLMLKANIFEL